MKRFALMMAAAMLLIAGCNEESGPRKASSTTGDRTATASAGGGGVSSSGASTSAKAPAGSGGAQSASASAANVPSARATVPPPKAYFEAKADGKTYVFGSFASLQRFQVGDTSSFKWTNKTGPNGEAVALESDGATLDQSLWGEYEKSHPKK